VSPGGGDGPLGFDEEFESPEEAARRRRERLARRRDPDLEPPAEGDGLAPRARLQAGASKYGWFVGVIGVLLIAIVLLQGFGGHGDRGLGIKRGGGAPPFAAPLALAPLAAAARNDVNVAVKAGQGAAGNVPACSVRRADVLNLCTLYEKGPVVLAFFATRSQKCIQQLDRLDDAARLHPDISFAAVSIRGKLADVRQVIRARRWSFPVGYDHDGVLADAYGVAICPQITFIRRGGAVDSSSLGELSAAELEAKIAMLERSASGTTGTTGG
jgi:hypothetical protein